MIEATSIHERRTEHYGIVRIPYRIVGPGTSDMHEFPASYTRARGHEIESLID